MTEDKLLEMINKEIDGSISRSEKKRLQDYLHNHPESNKLYNELIDLDKTLDSAVELDPPQNLTKNILMRIDHTKYLPKINTGWSWDWLFSPRLRVAYSFIGGLLLGIILLGFFNNPFVRDTQSMSGTMGIRTERIASLPIADKNVNGTIAVTRKDRQYTLEVTLESNEIYEIVIGYTPENIQFTSVVPTSPQKTVVERLQNQLRLSGFKNAHHIITFTKHSDEAEFLSIMVVISQQEIISKKLILE